MGHDARAHVPYFSAMLSSPLPGSVPAVTRRTVLSLVLQGGRQLCLPLEDNLEVLGLRLPITSSSSALVLLTQPVQKELGGREPSRLVHGCRPTSCLCLQKSPAFIFLQLFTPPTFTAPFQSVLQFLRNQWKI